MSQSIWNKQSSAFPRLGEWSLPLFCSGEFAEITLYDRTREIIFEIFLFFVQSRYSTLVSCAREIIFVACSLFYNHAFSIIIWATSSEKAPNMRKNVQMYLILHMRKSSSGHLLSTEPSGHTTLKWRRTNVDATWSRRIDVDTTSFWCCVPAGKNS